MAGREEMGIDIPTALAPQTPALDESKHLPIVRDRRSGESVDQRQNHPALANIPERKFADHERVSRNLGVLEAVHERGQAGAEVIHPD